MEKKFVMEALSACTCARTLSRATGEAGGGDKLEHSIRKLNTILRPCGEGLVYTIEVV
eukprot:SAG22_NODE_209_length_15177_cov_9.282995_6_plen_58_part_00